MKTPGLALALSLTVGMVAFQASAQSEARGTQFFEQWDLNMDGQLTLQEAREKRGEVFYMFDTDADGSLNAAEWQAIDEHLAGEQAQGGVLHQMDGGMGHGGGQQGGPGAYMHAAMTSTATAPSQPPNSSPPPTGWS